MDIAIMEIEAVQALNKRSNSDKTYHLVASFREGDTPTREQLDDIEQTLCDALGMGDHQRFVAVHDNTQHVHIHVAINKVHPETHRNITPFRDFYHLQAACRELEERHGLQVDNGLPDAERISAKAQDYEAQQGLESFQSWASQEPRQRLQAVMERPSPSWGDVHASLAEYNLEITPRGAGLVIRDKDDHQLAVKASFFGRDFSKQSIEGRLGDFQASDIEPLNETIRYQPKPFAKTARRGLWEKHQDQRKTYSVEKKKALAELSVKNRVDYKALSDHFARRRALIRERKDIRGAKKRAEYSLLRIERLQAQAELRKRHAEQRTAALDSIPAAENWIQFLTREAESGEKSAVAALRRSKKRDDKPGASYISGRHDADPSLFSGMQYQVHRNGDVSYMIHGQKITDEGNRLCLGEANTDRSVETALRMARGQFGKRLKLKGSAEFQRQAARVAGHCGMDIVFSDANIEAEKISHVKAFRGRDPVTGFIESRNAVASRVNNLPPHRRFTDKDTGEAVYRGLRTTQGGPMVALLEKNNEFLVRAVDAKTAANLQKIRVGTPVSADVKSVKSTDRERS